MRIGVILACPVVFILGGRFMWGQFFQPEIVVMEQTIFSVVDVNTGRDVHRVDEAKTFLDRALADEVLHRMRDIDIAPAIRDLEPEVFSE
jgi:hypothetical protein